MTHESVSDDREAIAAALRRLADEDGVRFVFTTGGTGLTPDDVTPEATLDVIDREAPGYAETIRADSREHTPLGILTRGVSGVRGRTLIVNFPGSPKAIGQSWPVVEPTLRARRRDARAMIELDGVERRFGERVALAGVSVRVEEGQTLVVFGPNGAGKTTLLRVLAGLLRPHGGTRRVLGAELPGEAWKAARQGRAARPRAAALPRPDPAREPALPRAAARRRPRRASTRCWPPSA